MTLPSLGLARMVVALSTLAGVAAAAWLSLPDGVLGVAVIIAFGVGVAGGRWQPVATLALILALGHVWPLLQLLLLGHGSPNGVAVWIAALVGISLAASPFAHWSLPRRWAPPVALWGLLLACAWPIVLWRELDFTLATMAEDRIINGIWAGSPRASALLTTTMTLAQLAAILLFDGLWARYGDRGVQAFVREVVAPTAVGLVASLAIGLYQGLVDLSWMSSGVWPGLGRAAGPYFDANAFGAHAGLWGGLVGGWATLQARAPVRAAGLALVALSLMAVWVSGSRTALLGSSILVGGLITALARSRVSRRALLIGVPVLAAAVLGAAAASGTGTALNRLWRTLPSPTLEGGSAFARAMWERDGYGVAASHAISEFPLTGVGPGAFQIVAPDYARLATGRAIPPDNAQNWWRHQLVELGVFGAMAPFVCSALAAATLLSLVRHPRRDPAAALLVGAVVSLGVMAMVGPPMAHPIVLQTAGLILFWATVLVPTAARGGPAANTRPAFSAGPALLSGVIWGLPLVWAGLTGRAAIDALRPPLRAAHVGWQYGYGFSAPEPAPGGGERRWAASRAVGVVPARRARLVLTLELPHEDLASRPVRVRVSDRFGRVMETERSSGEPFTCVLQIPQGDRWVMVQIETNRVWRRENEIERALQVTARFE